jgi:hypothetical protein
LNKAGIPVPEDTTSIACLKKIFRTAIIPPDRKRGLGNTDFSGSLQTQVGEFVHRTIAPSEFVLPDDQVLEHGVTSKAIGRSF